MEHFEKHLRDYKNIIYALKRRTVDESSCLEKYEPNFEEIRNNIMSLKRVLDSKMIPTLRNCHKNEVDYVNYDNQESTWNERNLKVASVVDIDKIKSMINPLDKYL